MTVSVLINGVALDPQPADILWDSSLTGGKLDGTDALGAYETVTLKAPVDRGISTGFNWGTYENQVLSSIVLPARFDTMRGTGVTYSSGVVSRRIKHIESPPGGIITGVEMAVMVIL